MLNIKNHLTAIKLETTCKATLSSKYGVFMRKALIWS